jgi:hypothetical protein
MIRSITSKHKNLQILNEYIHHITSDAGSNAKFLQLETNMITEYIHYSIESWPNLNAFLNKEKKICDKCPGEPIHKKLTKFNAVFRPLQTIPEEGWTLTRKDQS